MTTVDVTGVNKKWATKAVKWLKARNLLAFYDSTDRSLRAFEFKHGREWTDKMLRDALDATR